MPKEHEIHLVLGDKEKRDLEKSVADGLGRWGPSLMAHALGTIIVRAMNAGIKHLRVVAEPKAKAAKKAHK